MMRGWMLAGLRRDPGPLIGTVVALAAAAARRRGARRGRGTPRSRPVGWPAPAWWWPADTNLHVTIGHGEDARPEPAAGGLPGRPRRAGRPAGPGPRRGPAAGESGFPDGVVRPGDVDLVAVTAKPGVPADVLDGAVRTALHGRPGLHDRDRRGPRRRGGPERGRRAVRRPGPRRGAHPADRADLAVRAGRHDRAGGEPAAPPVRPAAHGRRHPRPGPPGDAGRAGGVRPAGGLLGWLPGAALGSSACDALAAHQLLPAGSAAWQTPWLLPVAGGVSVLVAVLSGQVAARRAGRTSPVQALRETAAERTWPHPVRILLGLAAAGGAGTLMAFTFGQKSSAGQLALAFPLLLACMVAVALLGPVLVALAAWLARPLRGPAARRPGWRWPRSPRSRAAPPRRSSRWPWRSPWSAASTSPTPRSRTPPSTQAASTVTADRVISGPGLDRRRPAAGPGAARGARRGRGVAAHPGGRRPGPGAGQRRGRGRRPARTRSSTWASPPAASLSCVPGSSR